jgi:hypothetical protein
MQSRRRSLTEAVTNTAIGFALSWLTGLVAYPLLGIKVSNAQNAAVVVVFTLVSLARSYTLRRLFNRAA